MSVRDRPNVLLFGSGSVGTVYLYLLSRVASVTAVCRSNYDVIKEQGVIINSSHFGQNIHFKPNVVKSCAEAAEDERPFDFVVVCTKAIPGTVPEAIRPAVATGRTAIVLIQNGIGIEDEYAMAFPNNPVVSCVVYLPATQRPAGVIKHGEVERLEVGNYPATSGSTCAKKFVELVQSAGATAELHDDVQLKRWFKLLVNASWNPLCALTLLNDADFMQSSAPATSLAFGIMLEVAEIAKACGYVISREEVDYQLGRAKARIPLKAGIEPSMMQDVKEGRRIEVEAILGNAITIGMEKGVACEKLTMLYVLAKALDASISKR